MLRTFVFLKIFPTCHFDPKGEIFFQPNEFAALMKISPFSRNDKKTKKLPIFSISSFFYNRIFNQF